MKPTCIQQCETDTNSYKKISQQKQRINVICTWKASHKKIILSVTVIAVCAAYDLFVHHKVKITDLLSMKFKKILVGMMMVCK
jgi:hypothetical protein